MDFDLGPEQGEVVARAEKVARECLAPRAAHVDATATHPVEGWRSLWENGLLATTVPREYGGLGLDLLTATIVLERLAMGCPSTTAGFHMHTVVQRYIDALASPEQKKVFYDEVVEQGKLFGSWGSEPGAHGGAGATRVVISRVDGGYMINGPKHFCTMAGACHRAMVHCNAPDEKGRHRTLMALVTCDSPGLKVTGDWNTLGMRGTISPVVTFEECFVPEEAVIGYPGQVEEKGVEQSFALGDAAIYLGMAQSAVDWMREYAMTHRFDPDPAPMSHSLLMQRAVAELQLEIEAARYVLYRSCMGYWEEDNMGRWYLVCKAKYMTSEAAVKAANASIQALGGRAAHRRYPLERIVRDIRTATLMPPSPERCLEIVGKHEMGLVDTQLAERWGGESGESILIR